jgi:phage-related protein
VALAATFYKTAADTEPVREWLLGMSKAIRKVIGSDINTVETMWPIGKPLVDGFGGGVWEVRSTHDKIEYRVLFGIVGRHMVLLHGFVKKTKATPKADLDLARARLAEVNKATARSKAAKVKAAKKQR